MERAGARGAAPSSCQGSRLQPTPSGAAGSIAGRREFPSSSPSRGRRARRRGRGRGCCAVASPRRPPRPLRSRPAASVPTRCCATDLLHPRDQGVPVPWPRCQAPRRHGRGVHLPRASNPSARRRRQPRGWRGGRARRGSARTRRRLRLPSASQRLGSMSCSLSCAWSRLVSSAVGRASRRGRGSAAPRPLSGATQRGEGGRVARRSNPAVITRGGTLVPSAPATTFQVGATTSAAGLPFRVQDAGWGPWLCDPAFQPVCPCRFVVRGATDYSPCLCLSNASCFKWLVFKREIDVSAAACQVRWTVNFLRGGRKFPLCQPWRKSSMCTSFASGAGAPGEWMVSSRKCRASGKALENMFALPGSFSKVATISPL